MSVLSDMGKSVHEAAVKEVVDEVVRAKFDDITLLTIEQVAALWGVSSVTVRTHPGLTPVFFGKSVRYRLRDLKEFLDESE